MKYALIAFDLDGTALYSDKTIAARTLRALQAAHEAGALIVPATGRIYAGIPQALRLQPFARYAIVINGAKLYDAAEDQVLDRAEIPNALALEVLDYLDGLDAIYDCYKDDWGLVSQPFYDRAADFIRDKGILQLFYRTRRTVPSLRDYLRADGGSVQKLQLHFADDRAQRRELARLPELFPSLAVSTSVPGNIEMNIAAANKGDALLRLCQFLEIPQERTLAFGDGTNDSSMLRAAGLGVAMGNADFPVKAAADTVCDDNDHDGLAKFLERLLAET